jgi:hypothetical protein
MALHAAVQGPLLLNSLIMTTEAATILEGILSGGIGGSLAVLGALWAVRKGIHDLEDVEIRRHRVACVTNLYALCPIFSKRPPGPLPREQDVAAFSFEINRAKLLFAGTPSVTDGIRDLHLTLSKPNVDAGMQFFALIKHMGEQTGLRLDRLSDADLATVFNIGSNQPAIPLPPAARRGA